MHLALKLGELFLQMRRLRGESLRWLLQICRVELCEIARHALLQLLATALDLAFCEVLVTRVDRLELRSVAGDARFVSNPIRRQNSTNFAHTFLMPRPLTRRKSAIVLSSGESRCNSQITSRLRLASRSSRRLDWMR